LVYKRVYPVGEGKKNISPPLPSPPLPSPLDPRKKKSNC